MTKTPHPGRTAAGRFTQGNGGRPKGSRNRTSAAQVQAGLKGVTALILDHLRRHHAEAYVDVIRRMTAALPRTVEERSDRI